MGNSVPADRRVTPPTELTGGPRRVCPRQAAPAVLPSRTRSGGSRSRVGPDDGSPSQQGFTPRRGERSSGALDREGTGCRQLGAGRLGQRAVGAPLRPWSDPGQVTHGEPGSAENRRNEVLPSRWLLRGPDAMRPVPGFSTSMKSSVRVPQSFSPDTITGPAAEALPDKFLEGNQRRAYRTSGRETVHKRR